MAVCLSVCQAGGTQQLGSPRKDSPSRKEIVRPMRTHACTQARTHARKHTHTHTHTNCLPPRRKSSKSQPKSIPGPRLTAIILAYHCSLVPSPGKNQPCQQWLHSDSTRERRRMQSTSPENDSTRQLELAVRHPLHLGSGVGGTDFDRPSAFCLITHA